MKVLFLTLLLFLSDSSLACSFLSSPFTKENVMGSEIIFLGEVISNEKSGKYDYAVSIRVLTQLRGNISNNIVLINTIDGGSCSADITVGSEYLFSISNRQLNGESSIGGFNAWPITLEPNTIDQIVSELAPVNQALKAQPSAAGTPQSGAP